MKLQVTTSNGQNSNHRTWSGAYRAYRAVQEYHGARIEDLDTHETYFAQWGDIVSNSNGEVVWSNTTLSPSLSKIPVD
jgi:hypothetical protein